MKHQSETGCGAQRRKAAQFSIKFAYKMKAHWPTLQHLARHVKPFSTSLHCFLSTKSSQITNTLYMYPSSIAAQKGNKICRGQCLAQTQTQASSLRSPLAVAHLWALARFLANSYKFGAAPDKKLKINQSNGEEWNSWFELKTATPYRAEQLLDTSYLSYEESHCSDSTK